MALCCFFSRFFAFLISDSSVISHIIISAGLVIRLLYIIDFLSHCYHFCPYKLLSQFLWSPDHNTSCHFSINGWIREGEGGGESISTLFLSSLQLLLNRRALRTLALSTLPVLSRPSLPRLHSLGCPWSLVLSLPIQSKASASGLQCRAPRLKLWRDGFEGEGRRREEWSPRYPYYLVDQRGKGSRIGPRKTTPQEHRIEIESTQVNYDSEQEGSA